MCKKIEPLQWDCKYSLSNTAIDEQQQKMFELFNELLSSTCDAKAKKHIPITVNALNDQAKLFFSTEEKLLRTNGYPDCDTHVKRHRGFIRAAIELRRKIADTPDTLEPEDIQKLRELFIIHIESTVQLCLPFLRIQAYIKGKNQQ